MGIELILGAASLAVGVISSASASADRKKAAAAQKQVNNITNAQQKVNSFEDRRQRLREERMRRASMEQGSQNTGTSGSSGEGGGLSALSTNFQTLLSQQAGMTKANEGINKWNQKAVDFETKARETLAWGDVFSEGLNTAGNLFKLKD